MTREEASGDLISRQAVLNTLDRMDKALDTDRTVESYNELLTECYKDLPPVEQEPRKDEVILTNKEYRELVSNEYENGYAKGYREALEEDHPIEVEAAELQKAYNKGFEDCRQSILDMATTIQTDDYSGNEIIEVVDIDDVKALPPVKPQEPKWIPVSERLPIAGEYVGDVAKYYLVQNEYGDMLVARYTHSEYWEQIYQMKPIADEIVAWMPLPEPYKAESEG